MTTVSPPAMLRDISEEGLGKSKNQRTEEIYSKKMSSIEGHEYQPQHPLKVQVKFAMASEKLANWS